MIHNILRLFVNTLTVNGKHYLINRDNLTQQIEMQLSEKRKNFLNFLLRFQNLYEILNIWQKRMTLVPDVFLEVAAPKNMVR